MKFKACPWQALMYSMQIWAFWRIQSVTRHSEAWRQDKKVHFRKNLKGLSDGWRKQCWPQDDNGTCGTGVGRESRRSLKFIKLQNKKQLRQAVTWGWGKVGQIWGESVKQMKFSLAVKCVSRMKTAGGGNDTSLWLEMAERWQHKRSDWQWGRVGATEGDISLLLHLQLTRALHPNLSYVRDNINQEGKGKYICISKCLWPCIANTYYPNSLLLLSCP